MASPKLKEIADWFEKIWGEFPSKIVEIFFRSADSSMKKILVTEWKQNTNLKSIVMEKVIFLTCDFQIYE